MSVDDDYEDTAARLAYLLLLKKLRAKLVFKLHGRRIPLHALADRFFIFFAAGVVKTKEKIHADVRELSGCSYEHFKAEVDNFVRSQFDWLYARYRSLLTLDKFPFMWSDGNLSVEPLTDENKDEEESLTYLDDYMFSRYGLVDVAGDDGGEEKPNDFEHGVQDGECNDEKVKKGATSKHRRKGM